MVASDRFDLTDQMINLRRSAVQLDDEKCLDIKGVADLDKSLSGMDGRPIHHLHARRDDPGANHRGDATGGGPCARPATNAEAGSLPRARA